MIEGSKEVRVSPAVFELIQTDPETVSKVLNVQILPNPPAEAVPSAGARGDEMEWCPMCETHSIARGLCWKCGRDFHTGRAGARARRPEIPMRLPTVREFLPNRVAKMFRDIDPQRLKRRAAQ
jgi:hypothetical protein